VIIIVINFLETRTFRDPGITDHKEFWILVAYSILRSGRMGVAVSGNPLREGVRYRQLTSWRKREASSLS